ncbi:hypothetical protein Pst134EA_032524 [Puccinia striiformis f. sp. tritici]|nr:uncharacterized protein Pst134EA_032524 [Puccinia striiformis f. sp. tritici]KAH9441722.1 hypothetical protein Pst134EA_032524 [Puccinia striiformis f. sp. tritici]
MTHPTPASVPPVSPVDKHPVKITPPADSSEDQSIRDLLRGLLKAQHTSMLQAQSEREASASRIARLEEALVAMSVKSEPQERSPLPETGRIDRQLFKTTDGPLFQGPFQAVEPFLTWIHGVEIFFATKGVTHIEDKVWIVGSLIRETNTLSFYANNVESFANKSWDDFKNLIYAFALPPNWRTELRRQVRHLLMSDSETFLAYSIRARTLQSMLNFDGVTLGDLELGEAVTLGLPADLMARVNDHQLLLPAPFSYSAFEARAAGFYESICNQRNTRSGP